MSEPDDGAGLNHRAACDLGYWEPAHEAIEALDPGFAEAWYRLAAVPGKNDHLGPKVRALVALSASAAATHLYAPGVRRQVRNALAAGATRDELAEVVAIASALGIHALTIGVPLLLQALEECGQRDGPAKLDARQERLKAEFTRDRGYWHDLWDGPLEIDPDMFEAYLDFSAYPWRSGLLEPKVKEFVYCAFDASATHLFVPGMRRHMRNALRYGATPEELMEVLELVSALGIHGAEMAAPILIEELARAQAGPDG